MNKTMKVLIVVDMQNDFVTGPLGTLEARSIVTPIENKIKEFNNWHKPNLILFTKDTHYLHNYASTLEGKNIRKHCIKNSDGWCIVKPLSSMVTETSKNTIIYSDEKYGIKVNRIEKKTFGSNNLVNFIKDFEDMIEEVELCGVCTDICVISNALSIRQTCPNMRIIVNSSLCAGTTPEKHNAALDVMESCQINVIRH